MKRRKWQSEIAYTVIDSNGRERSGVIVVNKAMPKSMAAEMAEVTFLVEADIGGPVAEFRKLQIAQRVTIK